MNTVYFLPPPTETITFPLEVTGESNYQPAIKQAILFEYMVEKDDLKFKDEKLTASLILEDDNKFDPNNAVRVDIENKAVGYLTKSAAKAYRRELERLNLKDTIGTCNAAVYMSREHQQQKMVFGVWLALELGTGKLILGDPPKPQPKNNYTLLAVIVIVLVLCSLILTQLGK